MSVWSSGPRRISEKLNFFFLFLSRERERERRAKMLSPARHMTRIDTKAVSLSSLARSNGPDGCKLSWSPSLSSACSGAVAGSSWFKALLLILSLSPTVPTVPLSASQGRGLLWCKPAWFHSLFLWIHVECITHSLSHFYSAPQPSMAVE